MILLLDNYDSFTYNLVDYLEQIGLDVMVKKNDEDFNAIISQDWEALIISPGPETPDKSGITIPLIDHYHNQIPILGICLGFQAIGQFFGATLSKCNMPMHGKISAIHVENSPLFNAIPASINVTRYHSLGLYDLPTVLKITSYVTATKEIMSFDHVSRPISGLQFHPEAWLTEYGLDILRNWATFNKLVQHN